MKRLEADSFDKARNFLMTNGRNLEKELYRFEFEAGSKEEVLEALKAYQNEDGGFGKKMEADFQLDCSSPMATSHAFQIFKALDVSGEHAMVKDAIGYLIDSYDDVNGRWHAVPPEVNDVPHAPWWHYDHEHKRVMVEAAWGNPNAELTGYLLRYSELVPKELRENLKSRSLSHFQELDTLDMHETFCYLRLADELDTEEKTLIVEKVKEHIPELVNMDREQWKHYGMQPVQLATHPQSEFYSLLEKQVEENLDYIISSQQPDGSWLPNWEWGQYEEDWLKAREQWKGILTYQNLKLLKAYDRINHQLINT
ncbi:prenyltransferase/squalene oxidase repeat-containing protein [Pseudalkalibacillus sp. SCS-8]|uniref:prenyltransferase/squalene oxidase repeat-containing protein n=1 Tax=Pseudalkalibacillus nanhaiensis TaxID=3115291 RepID=UPI0032DB73E4